jgi:GNAT superfamily N-acetyltransferase
VKDVRLPPGAQFAVLSRHHPRRHFDSGQALVNDWLRTKALQQQEKHLSVTKVLLDATGAILGYYTVAPGQADYIELPGELTKRLPQRPLPIALVAWLGVSQAHSGHGLGTLLLAQAMRDCYDAGRIFPFIAVVIDCINDDFKRFFQQFDFREVPGNPYRLYLSYAQLEAMLKSI